MPTKPHEAYNDYTCGCVGDDLRGLERRRLTKAASVHPYLLRATRACAAPNRDHPALTLRSSSAVFCLFRAPAR